jgi:hypothetical protein
MPISFLEKMSYSKTIIDISNKEEIKEFVLSLFDDSKTKNIPLARGDMISTYMINKNLHENPIFFELVKHIEDKASEYYGSALKVNELWANVTRKDGYLANHTHEPNKIAGAFYLQAEKDCGNVVVNFREEVDIHNNALVMFRGETHHFTKPNLSNTDRIIIGFMAN